MGVSKEHTASGISHYFILRKDKTKRHVFRLSQSHKEELTQVFRLSQTHKEEFTQVFRLSGTHKEELTQSPGTADSKR